MSKKDEEKNLTAASEDAAEDAVSETAADENKEVAEKPKKQKRQRTPEEEKERALNQVKRRKKFKYGALATIITVVVVAIIVLLNIICGILDKRFNWNIDMTSSGLYEISEDALNYLHKLPESVKEGKIQMVVMAQEDYFLDNSKLKVVSETLNRFQTESNGCIEVQYIDMTKNPEIVAQYKDKYNGEFSLGDIVVSYNDLVRVLDFDQDVISTTQTPDYTTYTYVTDYKFVGEQNLLGALMGVTDLHPVNVAIIDQSNGSAIYYQYEAYNLQAITTLLEKNNYQHTSVDIATGALDCETYDIALLMAPYDDLTEAQVQKLSDFLYNNGQYGKQLIYFASVFQSPNMPNLDAFLETWGIAVEDYYIIEGDENAGQQVNTAMGGKSQIPVAKIAESDYTAKLASQKLPLVAPFFRPLTQLYEANSGRTTKALLTTNDTCFLYPMDITEDEAAKFSQDDAEHGSYNLAVVATNNFNVNNEQLTSTILAFGSSWLMDILISESSAYNNADYFATVMNALSGKEGVMTIAEKSLNNTTITITQAQASAVRTVIIFVIPAVVAIIGIVVYIRRKNK